MESKMFAVYDSAVKAYLRPFQMSTRGEALRAWTDLVNDNSTNFCKHPQDYTLFELGSYDQETGKFTNHLTPQSLGVAVEFKRDLASEMVKDIQQAASK